LVVGRRAVAAFLLQSFLASRIKSPVYDEPAHIAAGLSYVEIASSPHPQHPSLKEMSGLSLLLGASAGRTVTKRGS